MISGFGHSFGANPREDGAGFGTVEGEQVREVSEAHTW